MVKNHNFILSQRFTFEQPGNDQSMVKKLEQIYKTLGYIFSLMN